MSYCCCPNPETCNAADDDLQANVVFPIHVLTWMYFYQENQRKHEGNMQTRLMQWSQTQLLSVSSRFYLLCCLRCVSALPQLDLSVGEAQLPQAGQLLLSVLQGLELGKASHSSCLFPKWPIERRRGEALPLGDTSVGQNFFQNETEDFLSTCRIHS